MSLEESVNEVCVKLTSVRATDRKKNAEALKEFLTRNAVPHLLTANTLKSSGLTWNHIFDVINNYIIKETEKVETAKNFTNVTAPLCKSLLHLCVAGSNNGKAYVKCDKITTACLYILNDKRLALAIGDAYLTLLYKDVFPVNYYTDCISSSTWEDLLDVCLSACLTKTSELDDLIKIRLLLYVVKNSTSCCQFVTPLRDALEKLKKYFIKIGNDRKVQEFIMEILIILIKTIAPESQQTMCEFIDSILSVILKFYEQYLDQRKKSLLFKLFELSINMHEQIIKKNTDGILAYDASVWNKHLCSVLEISCLEINFLQKTKKTNDYSSMQCQHFSYVAASALYKNFAISEQSYEDECSTSAKKSRVSLNKIKTFEDLIQELHYDPASWVGVLQMYVQHYGNSISPADYMSLIRTSEHILANSNKNLNWESFEQLICDAITRVIATNSTNKDNLEIILSLWNTCLRNVGVSNEENKVIQAVLQTIINFNLFKYATIQPLLILYFEKAMPVSSDSLNTLSVLLNKFYKKCCYLDVRMKLFSWLSHKNITDIENTAVEDILLRLVCFENISLAEKNNMNCDIDSYRTVMNTNNLFNINILQTQKVKMKHTETSKLEIHLEMNSVITQYFEETLSSSMENLQLKQLQLKEFMKILNVVLAYFNIILKFGLQTKNEVKIISLFIILQKALKLLYMYVTSLLKSDALFRDKIIILKCIRNILIKDYDELLNVEVRKCIEEDFFHAVNVLMKLEPDDEEEVCEDDLEVNINGLKQSCILMLASYCRKNYEYTEELSKCILDKDHYNFNTTWDIDCAMKCIRVLIDEQVENRPVALVFELMRNMCKVTFRNAKATFGLLQILKEIVEEIWSIGITQRQNSIIMIRSYLHRCSQMFYPPHVAALVYECAAKMIKLNDKADKDLDYTFREALTKGIKGDLHTVRLVCCHLLQYVAGDFTDADVEVLAEDIKEMFLIHVSEQKDTILKDELLNRTLTVLYSFYVLGRTRHVLMNKIIVTILKLQTESTMDKRLVKEMLQRLTENVSGTSIEVYLNTNIVYFLHYWFNKEKKFDSIPFYFFGFDDLKSFIEMHMKWLVPTETLWRCDGFLDRSDCLKYICARSKRPKEDIIETCFCNTLVLCLPYIVVDKYKLENESQMKFKLSKGANRTFQETRSLLKDEKWSNLFVENLGEALGLAAAYSRVRRPCAPSPDEDSYTFSKDVFLAILKYFGELIDGDIMRVLCESQPPVLFKILIKLWSGVVNEAVLELKIGRYDTFIMFVDNIPLGNESDSLLFNFACSSVMYAVKISDNNSQTKLFSDGLIIILKKIIKHSPRDSGFLYKNLLSEMFSIISMKKDQGFSGCDPLLSYLQTDFTGYFSDDGDVVDYVHLVQNGTEHEPQRSKTQFVNKLKTYLLTVSSASHEMLTNMVTYFKQNKHFVKQLTMELNDKGFSDKCGTSVVHQTISALCTILKSSEDEKVIVAACDCLSEICSFDLKTFVTVPPMENKAIVEMPPKLYLSKQVLSMLSAHLLDAECAVSRKVADAVTRLLAFRDGKAALDMCVINKKMLEAFSSSSCEVTSKYQIDGGKFNSCNNIIGYWVPSRGETHVAWISRVTMSLLNLLESPSNYIHSIRAVCDVKPSLCGTILPAVVGQILECLGAPHSQVLGEQINQVFKYVWDMSFDEGLVNNDDSNSTGVTSVVDDELKMIIHSLLDVVDFIRIQRIHYSVRNTPETSYLNYLNLEYNMVSWAATVADEHMSAIYYGELWAASHEGVPPASPRAASALPGGHHVQKIFRKCFMAIGEVDAVDGCDVAHLTCEEEKRRHLISSGQFSEALLVHDMALSRGLERGLQLGAATALHRSGLHHLALQYIRSLPENDELNSVKYECLSYLGDWSDFVDTRELHEESRTMTNATNVMKAMRYSCLKDCLTIQSSKEIDMKLVQPLCRAKLNAARMCKNLNMENCQNVYKLVSNLHLLRDIEDYFSVRCDRRPIAELVTAWSVQMLPPFNDFKHVEAVISQRRLLLEHAATSYPAHVVDINALQLQYAELGLSNQRIHLAQRVVAAMKQVEHSDKVTLLESQIFWAKGHRDIALSLLNGILSKQSEDIKWTAMAYRQYGLWMAESKRENARDIINEYLNKSLELLEHGRDTDTRLKVYYDIAKFADEEYKQIVNYMNSSTFEDKLKCMERMRGTAATLISSGQSLTRDEKKAYITNNAFKELDEAEIANTRAEKEMFLNLALRYYLRSLAQCEENNLSVFRVISLWFDNPGHEQSAEHVGPTVGPAVDPTVGALLAAVPAWKFIAVLPQMAPRLTTKTDQFSEHLRNLILRCAFEHPHHTLPILFSLKNSDKDASLRVASTSVRARAGRVEAGAGEERCRSAAVLVARVGAPASQHHALVNQMERVCDAIISFAYFEPKSKSLKPQSIPRGELIARLQNLDALPVPTDTVVVRKDCDYSGISHLKCFDNDFELVGGINYPKKIMCLSSDGKKRILLIKGEDDLRQDAVMQQVFNIVNTLLEKNPVTYRSKLHIRTYKVVPMSRRAGVLEWVAGTMPLGEYLLAAHVRYRPQDITPATARTKMKECHETRKSNSYKLQVFKEILKVFKPVFHHFFTENYLDPVTWYERRLAYTRSVAASSMVGYVLGLGDRHVQNVLVDKITAELVHIDFGIAFDQGKTLPTPETVPFRLTQDIIAGFGCSGVEGVFRRCCEKTLQLLRDSQETLLTILEVLLYDPLYLWSVSTDRSPGVAGREAGGASGALAARALLAVGGKLRGADGYAGGVATPGQVAGLLRTATDPANLCRLFPGWQPYL